MSDQECTVCQHVSSPHGVPVTGATSQSQADYERRMEALFAPIKREVQRLRTALADADNLSEDDL